MEHKLHPWSSFAIVPLFALANAGEQLSASELSAAFNSRVALGVAAGLLVGKPLGILLFTWVGCRLKFVELAPSMGFKHVAKSVMMRLKKRKRKRKIKKKKKRSLMINLK